MQQMRGNENMLLIVGAIIISIISFCMGRFVKKDMDEQRIDKATQAAERYHNMFLVMNRWVQKRNENKQIAKYLLDKGFYNVSIYGMGDIGKTLFKELKNSDVQVAYVLDRNADCMYAECDIYSLQDELQQVDAVIVTTLMDFEEIKKDITKKMECKIISVEEIVFGL